MATGAKAATRVGRREAGRAAGTRVGRREAWRAADDVSQPGEEYYNHHHQIHSVHSVKYVSFAFIESKKIWSAR